ncbi:MAG: hypothetical protein ACO1N3_03410 [Gammaproteobacteria bacterium]
MLLFRYLKKVKKPLILAAFTMLYPLSICFLELQSTILIFAWFALGGILSASIYTILTRFYPNPATELRRKLVLTSMALGMVGGLILSLLFLPHLFLFFNVLPFYISVTSVILTTFIALFEFFLRVPPNRRARALGSDYSLINILLNPFSSIEKLRILLIPELRLELLKLTQTQQDALKARQEKALQELKKHPGAIINDLALYNKHKTTLFADKTVEQLKQRTAGAILAGRGAQIQTLGPTLEQKLNGQAMDNTKKEANTLEESFIKDLSPAQIEAYKEYRRLSTELNSPHAYCLYSGLDLLDTPANQFVVLEKRVVQDGTTRCSERKTYFMHHENGFSRLLTMTVGQGILENEVEAFNPVDREPLFSPNANPHYPGQETEYKYLPYTLTDGHCLCLQLCEAIEALNLSLKPALNQQQRTTPVSTVSSTNNLSTNIGNYRDTPRANNVSIIEHSVFPQGTAVTASHPVTEAQRHSPGIV